VIGGALLIILATAGWRVYDYFRFKADETAGGRYEAALQLLRDGKTTEAQAALEAISRNSPAGYAELARLAAAGVVATHDPKAGIKAYDALITDPAYDESLKNLAQLRAAFLRLDTDTPKEFEERYAGLAAENGTYHSSLRELLALAALKDGDTAAAGKWLEQVITDPTTPIGLRRRADAFLALVQAGKLPSP